MKIFIKPLTEIDKQLGTLGAPKADFLLSRFKSNNIGKEKSEFLVQNYDPFALLEGGRADTLSQAPSDMLQGTSGAEETSVKTTSAKRAPKKKTFSEDDDGDFGMTKPKEPEVEKEKEIDEGAVYTVSESATDEMKDQSEQNTQMMNHQEKAFLQTGKHSEQVREFGESLAKSILPKLKQFRDQSSVLASQKEKSNKDYQCLMNIIGTYEAKTLINYTKVGGNFDTTQLVVGAPY